MFRALLFLLLFLQDRPLAEEIEKLAADHGLRGARVGIHLWSERKGEVLYAAQDGGRYTLASNTKVLTCAAALDRLGPEYKFVTNLEAELRDGTARLVIAGNGDPNISGRFFEGDPKALFKRWGKILKEKGVRRIEGVTLVNEGFDEETVCPGWAKYDAGPWWTAPFGTFSLNDNCVDVTIEPGEVGQPPKISIVPDTKFVTVRNRMQTVKKSPKPWGFARRAGSNEIVFHGEMLAGSKPVKNWVSIHDPYAFYGAVLRETLAESGLEVAGSVERSPKSPAGLVRIDSHSTDLAATIRVCLTVSQNFYAEMILRTLGRESKGAGTRENGLAAVREFLQRAGVTDYAQADGSGLSVDNRMAPRDLVKVFRHMAAHRHARVFRESLAANGGETGTLRRRMTAKEFAGRVRAKTGHISGVANLSGYLETASEGTIVFSILVNDWKSGGRPDPFQDRLCERILR